MAIPVAVRSKASVYSSSLVGVAGSNQARDMDVCLLCVLSGRDLCDGPITRPDDSYRLRYIVVCDRETSWKRKPWPTGGCCTPHKNTIKNRRFNTANPRILLLLNRPLQLAVSFGPLNNCLPTVPISYTLLPVLDPHCLHFLSYVIFPSDLTFSYSSPRRCIEDVKLFLWIQDTDLLNRVQLYFLLCIKNVLSYFKNG
jgi:hypothetical protein